MARPVALVLSALLIAQTESVAAYQDLDTTDAPISDSISPQQSSSEYLSDSIADDGLTNSSVANNSLHMEAKPNFDIVSESNDTILNTTSGSTETTNLSSASLNNTNKITRRSSEESHDSTTPIPNIKEEKTQTEIPETTKKESVKDINPISFHLEKDIINQLNDVTDNKQKTTVVRSADDSIDDVDDGGKSSMVVTQAITIAHVDDGNPNPDMVNPMSDYNVTPEVVSQPLQYGSSIKRVPRDDIISAQDLIVENIIVTCAYEGEMQLVRSTRAGCLVCACIGARSPRAVCTACGACSMLPLTPSPPPTPAPRPLPSVVSPCDKYPPRQIFADTLNPCRQCICIPNAIGILTPTCMPNPDCKKQPPDAYSQIIPTSPWVPAPPTDMPPMFPYPSVPTSPEIMPPQYPPINPSNPDIQKIPNLYPLPPLFPPVIIPSSTPVPLKPYQPTYFPEQPSILPQQPSIEPIPLPPSYPTTPIAPLPTGLDEPLKWPPKSPLPGPRPHKSCAPFPAGVPFQHPWSECLACICEHVTAPPVSDIEVTCYTKPSCCIESTTSVGYPREPTTGLQILDRICESHPIGSPFLDPRDSCRTCVCRAFGTRIAPACTPAPLSSPLLCGIPSEKKTKQISIKFIEPRCKYISPYQTWAAGCKRCVCETVFNYVISQCTAIPNCISPTTRPNTPLPQGIPGSSWPSSIAANPGTQNQLSMFRPTNDLNPGTQNQLSMFRPTNDLNLEYYQNNHPPNSNPSYTYFPSTSSEQSLAEPTFASGQAAAFAEIDSTAGFAQAGIPTSGDANLLAQAESSAVNRYPYSSAQSQAQIAALSDSAFAQADTSYQYPPSLSAAGTPQTEMPSNDLNFIDTSGNSIQPAQSKLLDGSPYGSMSFQPQSLSSNPVSGFPYDNVYPFSSNGKPTLGSGNNFPSFGSPYSFDPSNSYGQTGAPPTVNSSPYSSNAYPYQQSLDPFQPVTIPPPAVSPYSYLNPYSSGNNPTPPSVSAVSQAESSVFENSHLYPPGSSGGSAAVSALASATVQAENSYPYSPSSDSVLASASAQAESSYMNPNQYSSNSQSSAIAQIEAGNTFLGNSGNPYNSALPVSSNIDPSIGYSTPSIGAGGPLYPQTNSPLSPTEGYYSPTTSYPPTYVRPTFSPPWSTSSNSPGYRGNIYSAAEASAKGSASDPISNARLYPTGGRGQCKFDGDMYHDRCQACFCRANAAGNLLATCYGTPCS